MKLLSAAAQSWWLAMAMVVAKAPAVEGKKRAASKAFKGGGAGGKLDICSVANPAATQAAIIMGRDSISYIYLGSGVGFSRVGFRGVNSGNYPYFHGAFPDDNRLLLHSQKAYSVFADEVKVWLAHPGTLMAVNQIKEVGKQVGELEPHRSVSIKNQCEMMAILVIQMKDSCNFDVGIDDYAQVSAALMTGFNEASDVPKDNFVDFCVGEDLLQAFPTLW